MSDDKTYGFKLGDDKLPEPEEPPLDDLLVSSEMPPSTYDRLRRRITLLAVLMPLLLAALVVAGYLDIKRRVSQTENAGTMEVLNLSRDLESSFSSLSVRQAKLEEAMAKMIAEAEKKTAALKTSLQSDLNKAVAEVRALEKDLAGLKQSMAAMEKKRLAEIGRLKKDLRALKAEVKSVGGDFKLAGQKAAARVSNIETSLAEMRSQLSDLAEAMRLATVSIMEAKSRAMDAEENLRKVKSELEAQLATKLDRRSLSDELNAEQQRYEKKMARLTARLSDRIFTLEKKVALLTTYMTRLRKSIKTTTRIPKKVQEQDIKE